MKLNPGTKRRFVDVPLDFLELNKGEWLQAYLGGQPVEVKYMPDGRRKVVLPDNGEWTVTTFEKEYPETQGI